MLDLHDLGRTVVQGRCDVCLPFRAVPSGFAVSNHRLVQALQYAASDNGVEYRRPAAMVSAGRYIDMLALNDAHIAKYGQVDTKSKMQDSKTDMNYVLARRPDIIVGFLQSASLLANQCQAEMHGDRSRMMHDVVSNPIFQHEYVLVANGPYQEDSQAVFLRADYLKRLAAPELVGIPIAKTILASPDCQ